MAGTVMAGASAVALTGSLAACTPSSTAAGAGSPLATIFPGTAPAQPAGTSRAHATGVESGRPAGAHGASRGSARAARLLREALADPDAIAVAGPDVWV